MLAGAMGEFSPGSMINHYRVGPVLGRGGMGVVYGAENTLSGDSCAVKVLTTVFESDEARGRFFDEMRLGTKFNHPNIVEVIDKGVFEKKIPYFVMPRLGGTDLGSILKSRANDPMTFEEAHSILKQVMDAVEYAHNHRDRIVHRDLKPENIFICNDGDGDVVVKVLDFGIAKFLNGSSSVETTQDGRMLGTPSYMSPEQAGGHNSEIDRRTDIFALGAIMFHMLEGRRPFAGDNPAQIMAKIIINERRPFLRTAPAVQNVINQAMNNHPDGRFQSIGELRAALTGIPKDSTLSSPLPSRAAATLELGAESTALATPPAITPTAITPTAITPMASSMTMVPRRRRGKFRYVLAFLALTGAGTYLGYRFDKPAGFRGRVDQIIQKGKKQLEDWGIKP